MGSKRWGAIAAYNLYNEGPQARMPSLSAETKIRTARRRSRAFPAKARRRRRVLLSGAASLLLALGSAFSMATFTGVDLANAAVERAKTLSDLLNARSPGERIQGQLSNTKHKRSVLAEREPEGAGIKEPLKNLAEALAPISPATVDVDAPPQVPEFALEVPPPPIISPPGVVIPPPGGTPGGPGGPPGQPPDNPPPNQPPPVSPPPLPEPGTWMMMILGFTMVGHALRRNAAKPHRLVS